MTRLALFFLVFTVAAGGQASAQENLDAGKKPAQLFANDCSGCHKSPAGLSKSPNLFGLESFLREHYTASRQSAALIAGYLRSVDAEQAAAAAPKRRRSEPKPKADDKPAKRPDSKSDSTESKTETAKPASEKPAEPKAADSKPAESKPAETKPPAGPSAPAAASDKSN